jgi:hypothetical protein
LSDGDTLTAGLTFPVAGLHILDTNASHDLILSPGSNLTADRTLTLTTGDEDRTLTIGASASVSGSNTGDQDLSGKADAASFIAGAGALTGPAAPLTIGTAAGAATSDFAAAAHAHEGTAILSTGEAGGTKFLREDGDGTCSWQTPAGGSEAWDGDIADINLDGGTDIGADLTDADLILVDDGGAGTNRKCAMSRIKIYIGTPPAFTAFV